MTSSVQLEQGLFSAIMEASEDAIIGSSLDGTITLWNRGAERMFGYPALQAMGRSVSMVVPEDHQGEPEMARERIRQGQNVEPYESVRIHRDGTRIPVSITVSPIPGSDGSVQGSCAFIRHIGEQKRVEEALRASEERSREEARRAEGANRAKDRFLAVLSHELRTPLTPALAAVETLRAGELSEEQQTTLETVRRNILLEARLIDDLLDMSRMLSGKLRLDREVVDLHEMINHALDTCRTHFEDRRIEVELNAADHHVHGDGARLQQILWNLIDNAIKATQSDGTIAIRTHDADDRIEVDVEDDGVGMEPEVLAVIFDAFEQGEQGDGIEGRRQRGLGLGLSISNALTRLHGGALQADSEGVGRGSRFRLRLPVHERPVEQPQRAPTGPWTPLEGASILLVDDNADTAEMFKMLLEHHGCVVETAGTVEEAVAAVNARKPQVLLSDISLPDGTGGDILRRLGPSHPPAVAMSGHGSAAEIRRSMEAGFLDHLVKPVGARQLQEAVMQALASTT